ncbi:outer membrane protein [Aliidiomarina sp. Khilg15.8]
MKPFLLMAAFALALLSSPAQASKSPSFDSLGIGHAKINFVGEDLSGVSFDAEKTLPGRFFLSADLLYFSEVFNNRAVDHNLNDHAPTSVYSFLNANLNYKLIENGPFAAYAGVGISHVGGDALVDGMFSASDTGSGWNILYGVRHAFTSDIELDLNIRHRDLGDTSDQIVNIGARVYPSKRLSLNLGYTKIDSDFNYVEFGASFHF